MPFSEIIGQDRAIAALRSALASGKLHHAYLFSGPEGVGKASTARLLAQAVNCERGGFDACGACVQCRKIARGVHPDVAVVERERVMAKAGAWEPKAGRTPSGDVVVDQVRELIDRRLAMKRFEARRRVIIVDPADAMNVQAQNALLKTLEEPPDETTIVLVAAAPDALLPTIRSRCVRVGFGALPEAFVVARLVEKGLPPDAARVASALSGGSLGVALGLDADALAAREQAVRSAAELDPDDASTWLEFARRHGEDRQGARDTCGLLALWLRDVVAFQAAGEAAPLVLADLVSYTRRAAAASDPAGVLARIDGARSAAAALEQNAQPTLALERMLIGWFDGGLR